jgi:hypothetical protein
MRALSVISRTRRSTGRPLSCSACAHVVQEVRVHQLPGRDVDVDASGGEGRDALGPPLRVEARLPQDPPAEVDDEPALLGQRDEQVRPYEPVPGRRQRTSASAPTGRPDASSMTGW